MSPCRVNAAKEDLVGQDHVLVEEVQVDLCSSRRGRNARQCNYSAGCCLGRGFPDDGADTGAFDDNFRRNCKVSCRARVVSSAQTPYERQA